MLHYFCRHDISGHFCSVFVQNVMIFLTPWQRVLSFVKVSFHLSVLRSVQAAGFLCRLIFCNYKDLVSDSVHICSQVCNLKEILDLWPLTIMQLFFLGQLTMLRGPTFGEYVFTSYRVNFYSIIWTYQMWPYIIGKYPKVFGF